MFLVYSLRKNICVSCLMFSEKQDLDFGMPDPHPMDSTFGNTQMFGKMCYLNAFIKCLARCVI